MIAILILTIFCLVAVVGVELLVIAFLWRVCRMAGKEITATKKQADSFEKELRRVARENFEMRTGKDRVLDAEVIG